MSATNPGLTPPAQPPYLGAAYYPEDWPLTQVDEDIRLMREAGLNCVRIAEFAWSRMEPAEGVYDFAWLHEVIAKLGQAGIATILCTPTATPPAWLSTAHPEILYVREDGTRVGHGGRRHTDPLSPVYREHTRRIVTRMAEEFGANPNIIGWQIDNELFPHDPFPYFASSNSPAAHAAFIEFLKERFGTVERLNEAWCTNLWSQTYPSFEQVPYPDSRTWHHPSLRTVWREFCEWSYYDYCKFQADILHRHVQVPVGTNMMVLFGLDFTKMNEFLDVALYDHYTYHENAWQAPFWYDILRPAKRRPFWTVETGASYSASVSGSGFSEKGYCTANSWIPIAMGGEMTSYWLWRTHWAGQELMHGSVVQSTGRPTHVFSEVQAIGAGFRKAADFINGTRPVNTGLALHCSTHAFHTFRDQPLLNGFEYSEWLRTRIYRPLMKAQWRYDFINPCMDLNDYKVVFSPFLVSLDESGLRERLKSWIEAGGTWIAGPLTDIRTIEGTKFTQAPFGSLEDWAGVYSPWDIPGEPRDFSLTWAADGREAKGSLWYNGFELREEPGRAPAQALATYNEYPFEGQAAVVSRPMGQGRIVILGTLPAGEDLPRLLAQVAAPAGVTPVAEASENLLYVPRAGAAGHGAIAIELDHKPATLTLPEPATDLLTGERLEGTIEIAPYGVKVLRYA